MPRWVLKKMRTENPGTTFVRRHEDGTVSRPSDAPRRVRTWYVCEPCNGWMNRHLEVPARPVIETFLDAKPCTLTPDKQTLAAGWVFKTAFMLGLTGYNPDWHPPDYALRHLRQTAKPPASAFVWIGCLYEDRGPMWARNPARLSWLQLPEVVVPNRSFAETFVINRLVGHVFVPAGLPRRAVGEVDSNFDNTMIRIWPPSPEPLEWPLPRGIVEKHLHAFIGRYRWGSRRGFGKTYRYPLGKHRD